MTARRGFLVLPGRVEEIEDDGMEWVYDEPTLYDDLVLAGYPLNDDTSLGGYYIDISVGPDGDLEAYTSGDHSATHDMGPASGLFLAWYRLHAEGED